MFEYLPPAPTRRVWGPMPPTGTGPIPGTATTWSGCANNFDELWLITPSAPTLTYQVGGASTITGAGAGAGFIVGRSAAWAVADNAKTEQAPASAATIAAILLFLP